MNQRIRELAEQCYHRYSEHHINLEKFAELIVRECAKVAGQEQVYNERHEIPVDIEQSVLEHFGVEE